MRGALGIIGLLIALVIGAFVYRSYFTGPGSAATMGSNNPRAAADVSGVKNDLMAIANAERAYMALNGKYASLEELQSSGTMNVNPAGRLGYTYSAEIEDKHFLISAKYTGPATGMPEFSIDETMQLAQK